MQALTIGDPRELATDVGPVIDEAAKAALDEHLEWLDKNAKQIVPAASFRRGRRTRQLRRSRDV